MCHFIYYKHVFKTRLKILTVLTHEPYTSLLHFFAKLTVGIPEGWELQFSENPIFGPNFFYSLLRPKKQQIRNKIFFCCSSKFRARAPSNFVVVKYSKGSRAGF
jgi:hypothetical protein